MYVLIEKLPGQCAVLAHDQRFIYYLITEKKCEPETDICQPETESGRHEVSLLPKWCQKDINTLNCCGLDKLQWSKVSKILEQVFKETNISITVYSLPCVGSKLQMHAM
ncbi:O-acetyl-ADP-ribose deacetylase 1-like [Poecilia formosa]|uniref:O-acetyl-ADP-ribose deacetylase 1-like n=1 Tax=Poecilia formosa TaxID=48698 RepID=UPI0007BA73B8|nr:PREDICTED: O-acetyl-ADP-ribose deacetylase 1-like [Poecilia formosa]